MLWVNRNCSPRFFRHFLQICLYKSTDTYERVAAATAIEQASSLSRRRSECLPSTGNSPTRPLPGWEMSQRSIHIILNMDSPDRGAGSRKESLERTQHYPGLLKFKGFPQDGILNTSTTLSAPRTKSLYLQLAHCKYHQSKPSF